MELGEADREPQLVSREQIELLCCELYFTAQQVFGPIFLQGPVERYYTSAVLGGEAVVGKEELSQSTDLEFSVDVEIDDKTEHQCLATYCFEISAKEPSTFEGYFVMSTRKYEINPSTFATVVSNQAFLTNADGTTILTPSENALSAYTIFPDDKSKEERKTFKKIIKNASSCLEQAQLKEVYDCINALTKVQRGD